MSATNLLKTRADLCSTNNIETRQRWRRIATRHTSSSTSAAAWVQSWSSEAGNCIQQSTSRVLEAGYCFPSVLTLYPCHPGGRVLCARRTYGLLFSSSCCFNSLRTTFSISGNSFRDKSHHV